MSFILDALKKSETDRQQRGTAEFANVPSSSGRREGPPAWLWVVGALLLVNLVVLVALMLRPDVKAVEPVARPVAQPTEQPVAEPPTRVANDFATQVEAARENAPPREEPVEAEAQVLPAPARPAPSVTISQEPMNTASLPTIYQLQADGQVVLPELHVDIHVYSERPEDRFAFVNMTKVKEGSRLAEGPLVEEITPDGVVLNHNGMTFLLPRD
jgi:general secretion pathway protein B